MPILVNFVTLMVTLEPNQTTKINAFVLILTTLMEMGFANFALNKLLDVSTVKVPLNVLFAIRMTILFQMPVEISACVRKDISITQSKKNVYNANLRSMDAKSAMLTVANV